MDTVRHTLSFGAGMVFGAFVYLLLHNVPRAWRISVFLHRGYTWRLACIMSKRPAYEKDYPDKVDKLERTTIAAWEKHKIK